MRFNAQLGWNPIFLALLAILLPSAAPAAQLEWIGGTDSSWHTPTNWAPIAAGGEDPIQRVPQDGDTVLLADTTNGNFVKLDGNSARLGGLTVAGGIELTTTGYLLRVEEGDAAQTVIRGHGSRLTVPALFATDSLRVVEGGTVALAHPTRPDDAMTVRVSHGALIDEMSQLTGNGRAVFGNASTPANSVVLNNEGTLRPAAFGLFVATLGGGVIDYDGESESGKIDADVQQDAWFVAEGPQADPFSGNLAVGAGDLVIGLHNLKDAQVEFNGGELMAVSDQLVATDTSFDVRSSGSFTADSHSPQTPHIQMTGVSVHVHEDARLGFGSSDQSGQYELAGRSFVLDDGSTLDTGSFGSLSLQFDELDLDGDTRPASILMPTFSGLGIEAPRIDNDPSSPAFDGTIEMHGAGLRVNVPGGWELDGRLNLYSTRSNRVRGTTLTVDGGEQDDGVYVSGDFSNTISADLVLTENARIIFPAFGELYLDGNVTSFAPELGVGEGQIIFRGELTKIAAPTRLGVHTRVERGTIVLDVDLTVSDDLHKFNTPTVLEVSADARVAGEGGIDVEGILLLDDGSVVDVPVINKGTLSLRQSADAQATVRNLEQTAEGTLSVRSSAFGPNPVLYVEEFARLNGALEIETFSQDIEHIELIAGAQNGISGRFSAYDLRTPSRGFWKVRYRPTSVTLDVVEVLSGDYNGDGAVEQGDLDLVLLNWGMGAMTPPEKWVNDLPSGLVDQDELDRVFLGWGDLAVLPQPGVVGVPEPTTGIALILALLTLFAWKRLIVADENRLATSQRRFPTRSQSQRRQVGQFPQSR